MLPACVGETDPTGPEGTFREGLAPEQDDRNFQGSFEMAAPAFFATVELRTHAAEHGQLATARVAIVDEGGEPVSGVAVYGVFTAGVHVDVQAHTDASGVAYFESAVSDGAQPGFDVELVSYEIAGELAYVRPQSVEPGDIATFIEHNGIVYGMGTSSGSEQPDAEDPDSGDGMGTSSGFASDENPEAPTDSGMGTSSGNTENE